VPKATDVSATGTGAWTAPEKTAPAGRTGKLDLSVPQVAGSAVAAVVAAKLASNLGVYGTILGAGVVSVLGTCGGTLLQQVFRHTGRQVQEVAVQARPKVRRVREQAWTRTDPNGMAGAAGTTDRTWALPSTDPAGTGPLTSANPSIGTDDPTTGADPLTGTFAGPAADTRTSTGAGAGPGTGVGPVNVPGHGSTSTSTSTDGYGAATSYRARTRNWKRPVIAVALAFGLTMAGITGYEAIAGENISGHGHGTTIGNAVSGHNSTRSGGGKHTPAPGGGSTPTDGSSTGPQGSDGGGRPGPGTTPSAPRSSNTPPTGSGSGKGDGSGTGGTSSGTSGGTHATPTPSSPTSPPPTASPTPTPTTSGGSGDNETGNATDDGLTP
jgi:hypothetical protein